jgi:hypothetical protein
MRHYDATGTHASVAYEPADNWDPDGESDGTSIAVEQPW